VTKIELALDKTLSMEEYNERVIKPAVPMLARKFRTRRRAINAAQGKLAVAFRDLERRERKLATERRRLEKRDALLRARLEALISAGGFITPELVVRRAIELFRNANTFLRETHERDTATDTTAG